MRRSLQSKHFAIVFPELDPEDVESYDPLGCFFFDPGDPLKDRLAFNLASILLTLYGRAPKALAEAVKESLGVEPVKYDLSNPVVAGHVFHVRNVLKQICMRCPEVRECPWGIAVLSLRVHSNK